MERMEVLYSVACDFLWHVISAWHLVFEPGERTVDDKRIMYEHLEYKAKAWEFDEARVADWLITERRTPLKRRGYSRDKALSFHQLVREAASQAVGTQAQKLRLAAHEASESYKSLDESTIVHYYYSAWLLHTLTTFRHILKEVTTALDYSQQAYAQVQPTMLGVIRKLQEELGSIPEQGHVNEATASDLRCDIEALSTELAVHWRDTVYVTVERIVSK